MILYIAASWNAKAQVQEASLLLQKAGFQVLDRWTRQPDGADPFQSAQEDLSDILAADALLRLEGLPSTSGGMYFETGFAWAKGQTIYVIGEKKGVFDHVPGIHFYGSLEEFIKAHAPFSLP